MLSVEFMILFLLAIGMVTLLSGEMLDYGGKMRERMEGARIGLSAEGKARAFETAYRSGISIQPIDARVEDSLIIDFGDKVIEAGGVFEYDRTEPL